MRVYAALSDRLLSVQLAAHDTAVEGSTLPVLTEPTIECLAAGRERPGRVFVGTVDAGLLRSLDAGGTWERVADFGDRITAVAISPHDPETAWIGTEPSAVYRSSDGGDSWTHLEGLTDLPSADRWSFPPRPQTHHVRWIEVDPTDPDRIYLGIEAGAFVRTTDGGDTWEDHPAGARRDNHTLATHPEAPDRVYAAAGDGYAESSDGGRTWAVIEEGLEHGYVWGMAVDPGDPDRVVVSAARGARSAHRPASAESYVYRRAGGVWELAMDDLPDPDGMVRAVLAAGTEPGEFYALTNRGLYRSSDGAASWERVPVEWAGDDGVGRGLAVVPSESADVETITHPRIDR